MKTARLAPLLIALAFATLLAGCGNKGPLVRPEAKADAGATP
jgi:predicted small lipoprotein YifL